MISRIPFGVIFVFVLFAFLARAQDDPDAQIGEQDIRVSGVKEREQAVASLIAQSETHINAGQFVEAARTLNRVGRFQIRMAALDESVATYLKALTLLKQQPDVKTEIDSQAGLANAYVWKSKCELVEAPVKRAIELSDQINYVAGKADALLTLSDCQNHNDHSLAFKTASEALELWRSINRKRGMAEAYVVMAHYQLAEDNLFDAGNYTEAALNLFTELNDVNEQAGMIIYRGYIDVRKGAWQDAISNYLRAQSMIDEKAEPYRMGQIIGSIGEAFMESGSPDIALQKYNEAIEYFRASHNPRVITGMSWLIGEAQYLNGKLPEALATLQAARNEAAASKDIALTAYCDDFLGRTYFALNDSDAALRSYQLAVDGYGTAKNAMEKARVQALIGQVYQQQGNLEEAKSYFNTALEGFRALEDRVNASATLYALGKLALQHNDVDGARAYFEESINLTEDFRRASTSSDLTAAFSAHIYDRYEAFVDCLMRKHALDPSLNQDVNAFETHELARARSLTDLLRATQTNLITGIDPELAQREKSLRQTLLAKKDSRIKLLKTSYAREDLTKIDAELAKLEADYDQVKSAIKSRFPAYDQITRPTKLTLAEIQREVLKDDNTVLLEYALGSQQSYLWAITRTSFKSYQLPARSEIEPTALSLSESLKKQQDNLNGPTAGADDATMAEQVAKLSKAILGPATDQLNHYRLLVIADGALQYVPFQMLTMPGTQTSELRPLMLDHEIVNEPSASTLALLLRESLNRRPPANSVAVLADPVFKADDSRVKRSGTSTLIASAQPAAADVKRGLRDVGVEGSEIPRLAASREEADSIIKTVPWRTGFEALDFEANRARVLGADLAQYRVVHFATHAMLDDDHPELSGILLSMVDEKGQQQNGYVQLRDVYNLKLPVDLVVLSACQSGVGKDVKGEGLISLTRGFMYAGASGVVASLWKVDDEATAELMKHFYEGLFKKTLTPAAALREAQLAIRQQKRWQEPYYWAGFVIQGRYDATLNQSRLTPTIKLAVLISSVAALLVVIFLAMRRRRRRIL